MKKIFTASRFRAPSTGPRQKNAKKLKVIKCETWSTIRPGKHAVHIILAWLFLKLISFLPSFHRETRQSSLQPHHLSRLLVSCRKRHLSCHIVEHDVVPWRYSKSTLSGNLGNSQGPCQINPPSFCSTNCTENLHKELKELEVGNF